MDERTLGILGGGQLGRMMVESANRLNIKTRILDASNSPAMQINSLDHIHGQFSDAAAVSKLSEVSDILTIEVEHVNVDALENCGIPVEPSPDTIRLIQDKFIQKQFWMKNNLPVAAAEDLEATEESLKRFGGKYGFPFVLKSRKNAYDGRGNYVVKAPNDIPAALRFLSKRELYAEQWVEFVKELAVMVVRSTDGTTYAYPTVETIQKDNICSLVIAPAPLDGSIRKKAAKVAEEAIAKLNGAGIFGVELFLLSDNEILINEIAPRPHNSGHYTQDACVTSQFEAHIRACLGLPLPLGFSQFSTETIHCIMLNVLGEEDPEKHKKICGRALKVPGAAVHLYGKSYRPNRKLGHINIVGSSFSDCLTKLEYIQGFDVAPTNIVSPPIVSIIMGSDSDLKVMKAACLVLEDFRIPFECKIVSAHRTPEKMVQHAKMARERGIKVIIAGAGGAAHLPGMVAALTTLPVIGVPIKGSSLDGVDSLYSIVQMPRGVPVATVAINNAMNAALLSIRLLSAFDPSLANHLEQFHDNQREEVLDKDEYLTKTGYSNYTWPKGK